MTISYCKRMKLEIASKPFWRDIFCEFLSTFLLLACICSISLSFGNEKKSVPLEVSLTMFLFLKYMQNFFNLFFLK